MGTRHCSVVVVHPPMSSRSLLADGIASVATKWAHDEGRDPFSERMADREGRVAVAKLKATAAWQEGLWRRWPSEECWPAKMDVYEAAAYLRVSPDTIRRAVVVARDGKARLAHQRLGSVYRFRKADLDEYGAVPGRR